MAMVNVIVIFIIVNYLCLEDFANLVFIFIYFYCTPK
jgi:hypothetical protein